MTGPTVRRLIFGLIVLVLAGDVAAVVALRSDADTAQGAPATSTIAPTTTATTRPVRSAVILRDDFGSATAYQSGDEPSARSTTGDGQLRLLFRRNLDIYKVLPPAAPEHDRIQSVRDVHLSIEARFLAGAPEDEFGLVCRHHGLDADTYLGAVAADGTWGIYRATLGSKRGPYVRRPLVTGREPGLRWHTLPRCRPPDRPRLRGGHADDDPAPPQRQGDRAGDRHGWAGARQRRLLRVVVQR